MRLANFQEHLKITIPGSVSVLCLALAGCATSSGSRLSTGGGPEMRFEMSGGGAQTLATITADGAQGPSISLGRFDNGATLRGTASGQPVQMQVQDNSARGIWGSAPITVAVTETDSGLQMNGMVAGQLSDWRATKELIEGKIGVCAYQLARVDTSYQGTRTCPGAQVRVPW